MTIGGFAVLVAVHCLANALYYLGYRHAVKDTLERLEQKGGPQ